MAFEIRNSVLIAPLVLLISCYSNKSNVETYIPIADFGISNPSASFLLKQYPSTDNSFDLDTILVSPGTEIFSQDSVIKKVIDEPNPFYSPSTEFRFILTKADSVTISINSPDSSIVKDVYSGFLNKGYYGLLLEENKIESGTYWINYRVGNQEKHRKFMLMR